MVACYEVMTGDKTKDKNVRYLACLMLKKKWWQAWAESGKEGKFRKR